MPGVWNPTAGATLGTATGAIRIDTSDVERAGTVTKASVKDITNAFDKIDQSAKKTKPGLVAMANDIDKVHGELLGLSVAAGGLTAIGLTTAGNLQVARVQLSGLLGGLQKSTDYTEQLRKKARDAGMPFNEMLKIATTLLPVLKGNTAELDRYANIADRLALQRPDLGAAGSAEQLKLAIASGGEEWGRFGRTFGITAEQMADALKQSSGDIVGALDLVLNSMGATNEAANLMDKTWNETLARARGSVEELLQTGFGPFLDTLTPLVDKTTEFAGQVQQTNPELLTMAAGMTAIAAAGGPALLMVGQMVTSFQKLNEVSAGGFGKAAGAGLAVAAGVGLGIEGTRAIGRATGNQEWANADLGDVVDVLRKTFLVVIDQVLKFGQWFAVDALVPLQNTIGKFVTYVGEAALTIANLIGKVFPDKGAMYAKGAQEMIDFGKSIQLTNVGIEAMRRTNEAERQKTLEWVAKALFPEMSPATGEAAGGTGGKTTKTAEEFTAEQIDAWVQFQQDLKDIDAQGAEQRLRINEQYQEAVANIEERLSDMRKNIAKAEQDAQDAEAKKEEDYQIRLGDIADDARQADIRAVADFNQQRARAEKAHQQTMWEAASRFDALGIIREWQSYNEKKKQAEEDFAVAQQQRSEELVQRYAQEAEAHNREMDELRSSNREKLNELRQQYAEEYRAAQDKLYKLREAHTRELQDLDTKLARERTARERAYIDQFNSLAGALANQITLSRNAQSTMVADLKKWWTDMQNSLGVSTSTPGSPVVAPPPPSSNSTLGGYTPPGYASGGRIPNDMLAYVHAGEEIIKPDVARQIRSAMGGTIDQPALAMAAAGGGMGGGLSVGSIPITIYGAVGQSAQDIAAAAREEFVRIIDKYNKSVR